MNKKTVSDFQKLTGLKEAPAKYCYDSFGGFCGALASFAQSFSKIPRDYFDDPDVPQRNEKEINKELTEIYQRAREQKKSLNGKSDLDVWKTVVDTPAEHLPSAMTAALPTNPALHFGFGTKTSSTASPNPGLNFGFGSSLVGKAAAPVFAETGNSLQLSAPSAEPTKKSEKKRVKYCDPSHNVGPFLEMPGFWEEEVEGGASLFNLDGGFLSRKKDTLRAMMEKWVAKASFYAKPVRYVEMDDPDEETVRVIIKDADRSFVQPHHREKLVAFLCAMREELGAYGQAMSYLAGLCMLVLTEEETAAVIRFVAKEYIPGHWAAEAVGFSTSAWVVEHFMQKLYPDVAQHIEKLKFWPDTYFQKILTGLCIHVLSFEQLFQFLNCFMEGGLQYLICFCLAVVEHFRANLLKITSSVQANTLYEIMSLNSRVCHVNDVKAILLRANVIDLGEEGDEIPVIRSTVYDKKVSPRLQRAPKVDTFEPCEVCDKNRPTWYCDELGTVCDPCKHKNPSFTYEKY